MSEAEMWAQTLQEYAENFNGYCPFDGTATELRRLQAEVEALRADAERYRWLRDGLLAADFDWNQSGNSVIVFD